MYVRVQLLYFPLVHVPYVSKKQLPILGNNSTIEISRAESN